MYDLIADIIKVHDHLTRQSSLAKSEVEFYTYLNIVAKVFGENAV